MVTPEGAALQRAVDRAFAQLGAACEAVRDRRKRPVLTISANGSISSLWLAPRLAAFAARHPSVQWQMRSIEDEAPDMVREGLGPRGLARPARHAGGGGPAVVQRNGVPGVQSVAAAGGRPGGTATAYAIAGGSRGQPGEGLVHLAGIAGLWVRHQGDGRAVLYVQCRARGGDRRGGDCARAAAADRPGPGGPAAGAAVSRPVAAGFVGLCHSPAPGAARDGHVGQLAAYLLGTS